MSLAELYLPWTFYSLLGFLVLIACLSATFVAGTVVVSGENNSRWGGAATTMASRRFQNAMTYGLLPLFMCCVIVAAALSGAFSMAVVMDAGK